MATSIIEKPITQTEMNGKLDFYILTSADLLPAIGAKAIGMGVIDNGAYFTLWSQWIALQFKVSSSHVLSRFKYGNGEWTAWTTLY